MESKVLSYFSSINPLAKRLIEDQKSVKDRYQTGEWERLSPSEQEAELDVYLIPQDYRDKYSRHEADDAVPESFPKLSIPSGEKIIVDMDNDCWTWQDEHSGPFSWKTKSQQNLSLFDLEPDQLQTSKSKRSRSPPLPDNIGLPWHLEERNHWEPLPMLHGHKDSGYPSSRNSGASAAMEDILIQPDDGVHASDYEITENMSDRKNLVNGSHIANPVVISDIEKVPKKSSTKSKDSKSSIKSATMSIKNKLMKSPASSKETSPSHSVSNGSKAPTTMMPTGNIKEGFVNPELLDDEMDSRGSSRSPAMWTTFGEKDSESDNLSSCTSSPSRKLIKEPEALDISRGETTPKKLSPKKSSSKTKVKDTTSLLSSTDYDLSSNSSLDRVVSNMGAVSVTQIDEDQNVSKSGFAFLDDW